jgi:hypothetical protein
MLQRDAHGSDTAIDRSACRRASRRAMRPAALLPALGSHDLPSEARFLLRSSSFLSLLPFGGMSLEGMLERAPSPPGSCNPLRWSDVARTIAFATAAIRWIKGHIKTRGNDTSRYTCGISAAVGSGRSAIDHNDARSILRRKVASP